MLTFCLMLRNLLSREEGQDLIEYALLASTIALVCIAGVGTLASSAYGLGASVVTKVIEVLS